MRFQIFRILNVLFLPYIFSYTGRVMGIVFFALFALMACSGCVRQENMLIPVQNPSKAWIENQKKIALITAFEVQGKVGISNGVSAQSIDVDWVQKNNGDYELNFYGPLEIKIGSLIKNSQGVFLKTSRQLLQADDPERLMLEEFGWSLPIKGLEYWIRALPAGLAGGQKLNAFGYLSELEEQGWKISYLNYGVAHGAVLPTRMILRRDDIKLVIVIEKWGQ